jgi:hypothetical protein
VANRCKPAMHILARSQAPMEVQRSPHIAVRVCTAVEAWRCTGMRSRILETNRRAAVKTGISHHLLSAGHGYQCGYERHNGLLLHCQGR